MKKEPAAKCRRLFHPLVSEFPPMRLLIRMVRDRSGASAAEYVMILAIVGAALAVAALSLGNTISDSINVSSGQIINCAGQC